jgi:hypothetical protein
LINRAQRHLNDDHIWSRWSHAFLFQGRRHDGQPWVQAPYRVRPRSSA